MTSVGLYHAERGASLTRWAFPIAIAAVLHVSGVATFISKRVAREEISNDSVEEGTYVTSLGTTSAEVNNRVGDRHHFR